MKNFISIDFAISVQVDLSGLYGKVESCYKIIAEHPHQMNLTAANFIRDPENEMLKKEIVELKGNS